MKSLKQLMDLSGRVVLITGGAGFIGRAMADAVAELGASVAVLDRRAEECQAVAADLTQRFGIAAMAVECELADDDALAAVPALVEAQLGGLDVLVNNAAFVGDSKLGGWAVPFEQQSVATWRSALEVNLTSAFALTQKAAPLLARSGRGSVINVSSIYGMVGPDLSLYEGTAMGNPAAYAASKGGLAQLTRWLSTVMAPQVRVNTITPGGVWRNQAEQFHQRYLAKTPLGRMAGEEDFKGAVAYLASDLSAYMTGQNLVIDGGWTAW